MISVSISKCIRTTSLLECNYTSELLFINIESERLSEHLIGARIPRQQERHYGQLIVYSVQQQNALQELQLRYFAANGITRSSVTRLPRRSSSDSHRAVPRWRPSGLAPVRSAILRRGGRAFSPVFLQHLGSGKKCVFLTYSFGMFFGCSGHLKVDISAPWSLRMPLGPAAETPKMPIKTSIIRARKPVTW